MIVNKREREERREFLMKFASALLSLVVLPLFLDIRYVKFSQKTPRIMSNPPSIDLTSVTLKVHISR